MEDGIVDDFFTGCDGAVRAAKLQAGKSHLEQLIQQLFPLEFTSDRQSRRPGNELNHNATMGDLGCCMRC